MNKFTIYVKYTRPDGSQVDLTETLEKSQAGYIIQLATELVAAIDDGCTEVEMGVMGDDCDNLEEKE